MPASRKLEETALSDAELIILAERELAAFSRAVGELFGAEQASLSAAEWIDELESLTWPARPGIPDFRRISTAGSARLGHREQFRARMIPTGATTPSRSDRL
jgi:hypothetical protein